MKKIRQLCLAALLTLTFALSASAGDQIECGRAVTPPSQSREGLIECGKLLTETVYAALTGVMAVL
jgi:hypothetical protein